MGTLDAILTEAGSQFGVSNSKTSSLLSSLLSLINETSGGLGTFLESSLSTRGGSNVGQVPEAAFARNDRGVESDTAIDVAPRKGARRELNTCQRVRQRPVQVR
jgi:hypothetical protein